MSRRQTLLMIGLFTFILPFLGLPPSWRAVLTALVGVLIVAISYVMKREEPKKEEVVTQVFTESRKESFISQ